MSSAGAFSFRGHRALFGGSFNPPHVGHVEAVKGLFKDPGVECVTLLPSYGTPLKKTDVGFDQRFEMLKTAFANELNREKIELSSLEQEEGHTYTWQALESWKTRATKLAFVIGTDQFVQLDKWNRYPQVMGMCDWIVLLRKPHALEAFGESIRKFVSAGWLVPTSNEHEFIIRIASQETRLKFIKTEAPAISSTEIRKSLELGNAEHVKSLIPASVLDFIERNKLYGT